MFWVFYNLLDFCLFLQPQWNFHSPGVRSWEKLRVQSTIQTPYRRKCFIALRNLCKKIKLQLDDLWNKKINFYLETQISILWVYLKKTQTHPWCLKKLKMSGRFKIDICAKSKKHKHIRSSFSNDEAKIWRATFQFFIQINMLIFLTV